MALREPPAVFADDEGDVDELGWRPAEEIIQLQLTEGAGQEIVAADDFRHAHCVIIDDDGQLIGGRAVRFGDHKVAELLLDVAGHFAGEDIIDRAS
jgi:hypothetical protein